MSAPSDDPRIVGALAGDREALTALLVEAGARLRHRLAAEVPRRWQALLAVDDVLQEAYSDAFVHIRQFVPRGSDSFMAWFTTIARRNLRDAIDLLQAEKRGGDRRRATCGSNSDAVDALANWLRAPSQAGPSRAVAREEFCGLLERVLAELPASARRLIELADLAEQPAESVAELLGCSVGALYVRRARIHRRLRELLGPTTGFFTDAV